MKFYIEGNNFIIDYEQKKFKGCLITFLIILSIFVLIIGLIFSIPIFLPNFKFNLLISIPAAFLIFGFLLLINSIKYLIDDYSPFTIIDKDNEIIKFYRNKKTILYETNFSDISHILTEHFIEEDSDGYRTDLYNIYFIKNDGSELWIYEIYDKETFTKIVNKLIDFTGFKLQDKTNLLFDKNKSKNYDKKNAFKIDYFYSIRETQEKDGIAFSLKNKKIKTLLIPLLVNFFLISIFFLIITLFLHKKLDLFVIILLGIFIIFLLIFIFIILSKILSNTIILASSDGITIKTVFSFFPSLKYKNFIPTQAIQNLTLNRNKDHIWSISIIYNQNYPEISKLFKKGLATLNKLAYKLVEYNYPDKALNLPVLEISEKIIGSDNYHNKNFIFELDYLIRKINEILRKNI